MDAYVGLFSAGLAVMVPTWLAIMVLRLIEGDDE